MSDSPVFVEALPSRTPTLFNLQPFWPTDPALWFASAESQFLIHQINAQNVKFAHVVSALQPDVMKELRDLILTPPKDNPYDVIKDRLCSMTSLLRARTIQQQIIDEQLGTDKPTEFLNRLQQKLDPILHGDHLKDVFMRKLPLTIQRVLDPVSSELNTTKLAQLADRIWTEQQSGIVQTDATPISMQIEQLQATIYDLKLAIDSLSDHNKLLNRQDEVNGVIKICWYHRRYGGKAYKCSRSCSLSKSFAIAIHPEND